MYNIRVLVSPILLRIIAISVILASSTKAAEPVNIDVKIYIGEILDNSTCHNGEFREGIVHLPKLPDDTDNAPKIPLVIVLHAMFLDDEKTMEASKFHEVGDEENFAVAYAEGYAKGYGFLGKVWNAGDCCVSSFDKARRVDDVGYIRKLIEYIQNELPKNHNFGIDTERIYVIGISNGGFMTYRVACEMSDIVAAVVPIAGPMMNTEEQSIPTIMQADPYECNPTRPVPLLHIHSTGDPIVPMGKENELTGKKPFWFDFQDSKSIGFPTVWYTIEQWRKFNGVTEEDGFRSEEVYNDATRWPFDVETRCISYGPNTSKTVQWCKIKKKGLKAHCWPGKQGESTCGNKYGNKQLWEFLEKYTLSSSIVR